MSQFCPCPRDYPVRQHVFAAYRSNSQRCQFQHQLLVRIAGIGPCGQSKVSRLLVGREDFAALIDGYRLGGPLFTVEQFQLAELLQEACLSGPSSSACAGYCRASFLVARCRKVGSRSTLSNALRVRSFEDSPEDPRLLAASSCQIVRSGGYDSTSGNCRSRLRIPSSSRKLAAGSLDLMLAQHFKCLTASSAQSLPTRRLGRHRRGNDARIGSPPVIAIPARTRACHDESRGT